MSSSRCFASALVAAACAACGSHDAAPAAIDFLVVKPAPAAMTWDDLTAIQALPAVRLAVPYRHANVQLASEDANWNAAVVGTSPDYFELRALHVVPGGRPLDAANANDKVIVLGETTATQLFGANANAVGQTVRVEHRPFTVIGVVAHQGTAATGQDLDDIALVPVHIFGSHISGGDRFVGELFVRPAAGADAARVEREVRSVLRDRHHLAPGADDDFTIRLPPPAAP